MRTNQARELRRAAEMVARALSAGQLTLGQAVGITKQELAAVAQAADMLRRQGRLADAAALLGLCITFDPLEPAHWRPMADLQRRLGNHAAAVACYEVLAAVADREAGDTRREARCLAQLGQVELAQSFTDHAAALQSARADTATGDLEVTGGAR